jgi:hypothetical protein
LDLYAFGPSRGHLGDRLAVAPVLTCQANPREAGLVLLDLADLPVLRMGGDAVRYRLIAASLLLRTTDQAGRHEQSPVAARRTGASG